MQTSTVRFDDLEDLEAFNAAPTTKPTKYTERAQYPCQHCAGSGLYRGARIHQEKSHCFSCKGRGFFLSSPEVRQKARSSAAAAKAKQQAAEQQRQQEAAAAWHAANPDLSAYLTATAEWSDFSRSMVESVAKYGSLTDRQAEAAKGSMAKHAQRAAEKAAEAESKAVISLEKIMSLFATARASGLKKPALVVGSLRINMAPSEGRNAGCLYVKDSGEYAGKITPEGKFFGLREARKEIEAELLEIAADPAGRMKAHGKLTGVCSCCGRPLTDPVSVASGIGPICAQKWSL